MHSLKRYFSVELLFYTGIFFNLLCVLLPDAFVTHDGPSHLYNAHIINQIIFSEGSIHEDFHSLNTNFIQPNLLGYLPLCLLQLFMPFLWAEKITIALYVFFFAFGFRFYLRQISKHAGWYALLALPFILNVVLFWGFFNFLFALVLHFYLLGMFEKFAERLQVGHVAFLFLLSVLVFYSHAMVFVFCGIYVLLRQLLAFFHTKTWTIVSVWNKLKPTLFLLPVTVLFLLYLAGQKNVSTVGADVFDLGERFGSLWLNIESLSFSGYSEGVYIVPMYLIILILAGRNLLHDIRKKKAVWTLAFCMMLFYLLALLFTPNAAAGGSVIIPRLNLLFFLFLVIWIAAQELTRPVKWMIGIFFIWSLPLLVLRYSFIEAASLQSRHVMESTTPFLRKNMVIGSVHYKPVSRFVGDYQIHSYFDIMANIDHYAALAHGCLTLHNYEADRPLDNSYFPVVWRDTSNVDIVWDKSHPQISMEFIQLDTLRKHGYSLPEHVLCIGQPPDTEMKQSVWDPLQEYRQVFVDSVSFLRVYRINEARRK